jgi:hypothetical protein
LVRVAAVDGTTPLIAAGEGGHIELVVMLLDDGADIEASEHGLLSSDFTLEGRIHDAWMHSINRTC